MKFTTTLSAIAMTIATSVSVAQVSTQTESSGSATATAIASGENTTSFGSRYYRNRFNEYEVTITNLTYNQVFSPSLVVSHRSSIALFEEGQPASEGIALMAEAGDVSGIIASVDGDNRVRGAGVTEGPLFPGQSTTITIPVNGGSKVSIVSMLVNTNDAFYAVNSASGPRPGRTRTVFPVAYDAGSEPNDELCANIPGPACGGEGASAVDGEGFIHVHRGLHGIGDLAASEYDWRNPVAKVTVRRK